MRTSLAGRHRPYVRSAVHPPQFFLAGGTRADAWQGHKWFTRQYFLYGLETFGAFGVPRPGLVRAKASIANYSDTSHDHRSITG